MEIVFKTSGAENLLFWTCEIGALLKFKGLF